GVQSGLRIPFPSINGLKCRVCRDIARRGASSSGHLGHEQYSFRTDYQMKCAVPVEPVTGRRACSIPPNRGAEASQLRSPSTTMGAWLTDALEARWQSY